jgi:hypothetical protein
VKNLLLENKRLSAQKFKIPGFSYSLNAMPLSGGGQDGTNPLVPARACPLSAPTAGWTAARGGCPMGI